MVRRTPTVTWLNPPSRVSVTHEQIVPVNKVETTRVHSSQPATIWTFLFKAETTVSTSWSQATAGLLRTDISVCKQTPMPFTLTHRGEPNLPC